MKSSELTKEELQFAFDNHIIDADEARSKFRMSKRQEIVKRFTQKFEKEPKQIQTGKYSGEWYVELPRISESDKRRKPRKKTKKEIEDIIIEFMEQFDNNPTLHELYTKSVNFGVSMGIKKRSRDRYNDTYKRHFTEFGEKQVKNVTAKDFVDFLHSQVENGKLKKDAFRDLKTVTRKILKQAETDGLINWDYEREVFRKLMVSDNSFDYQYKEDYELVFDEEETAKVIEYLSDNQDTRNLAVLLLFFTGMRVGEVVALKHDDLDPVNNTVKVRRIETRYKDNNGKWIYEIQNHPKSKSGFREIPLPNAGQSLIQRLYFMSANTEYVFEEDGERLLSDRIRKRLTKVCKKTGVYRKSPHKIRATYDTILLDSAVDRKTVMEIMGHSDIRVSERNYHRNRKTIADKRDILNNIDEFRRFQVG